jgi:hypothetical protein
MANAFYAAFGACKRKGYTSSYCYREAKKSLEGPCCDDCAPKRKRKKKRTFKRRAGMARKGWVCRKQTKVWSPALGKKVLRCTSGYRSKRAR